MKRDSDEADPDSPCLAQGIKSPEIHSRREAPRSQPREIESRNKSRLPPQALALSDVSFPSFRNPTCVGSRLQLDETFLVILGRFRARFHSEVMLRAQRSTQTPTSSLRPKISTLGVSEDLFRENFCSTGLTCELTYERDFHGMLIFPPISTLSDSRIRYGQLIYHPRNLHCS